MKGSNSIHSRLSVSTHYSLYTSIQHVFTIRLGDRRALLFADTHLVVVGLSLPIIWLRLKMALAPSLSL